MQVLLAYAIALWVGERFWEVFVLFGKAEVGLQGIRPSCCPAAGQVATLLGRLWLVKRISVAFGVDLCTGCQQAVFAFASLMSELQLYRIKFPK